MPSTAIAFDHEGKRYNASFSRHDDGRVAEIYLDGGIAYNNAARLASLSLAVGVDLQTVRRAVLGGPLAVALDMIMEMPA